MRRREFIAALSSAAAWPVVAWGQQPERVRRIGVLLPASADDGVFQARVGAFQQELALRGWTIGRNVRIDIHWGSANANNIRRHATELVALAPDVILAQGGTIAATLQQTSRTMPIVFVNVADPVGLGLVRSLARLGANATGFLSLEYATSGKWIALHLRVLHTRRQSTRPY